ncbi:MAG: type ISP restriction/modification enzyme [Gaiellaceae bacterium]
MSLIESYLRALTQLRGQVESTPELSLREPLLSLLRDLAIGLGRPRLLIAPEAAAEAAGQPDVFIKDGPRLVGFVETKAPGTDIGRWLRTSNQAARYRESLGNWVVTDYYRFVHIRDGEEVGHLEIGDPSGHAQLLPPAREEELRAALASFLAYTPPVLRSPQRLALELARRARLLRDGLQAAVESDVETPLTEIFGFYRRTLMSDLDEAGFADTFAQTIAYGLFLARLRNEDAEFTLERAIGSIPQSVPFLRSAVRLLTDRDMLPGTITRVIEDLVALLDNTRVSEIRDEIASGGLEHDLVVYFYERFLEQYDAGERKRRGVYYTPPELVGFLVRAVQKVLETRFRLKRGLADPLVTVLDPAVGTGTFLLGAAEVALGAEAERGTASQRRLIREHLLPDFYGFELLPAPYAVAHLKLASFYAGRGHELADDERLRVYLTNTLEPHEPGEGEQLSFLPMVRGIVEEARSAGHVKHRIPVLAILGNPPYERTSHNANKHSDDLLEDFYTLDGERLPDRNTGPLRDDYLRFLRWGIWKLLEQPDAPGHGVLALVTNRGYLERKLHRAVRRFLLSRFDEIHVFDLHGDQREWFADRVDEKVFKEVQAGIALSVFVKHPGTEAGEATVRYRDAFGRRQEKYAACREATIDDPGWRTLEPHGPLWLFVPYEVDPAYESWPTIADLFPVNVVGFQTHRDQLVVAFNEEELRERLAAFADPEVPDTEWEAQGVRQTADWNLAEARRLLSVEGPLRLIQITYRGLERRLIAFDERLIDRIRTSVSPHLLKRDDNLAIAFSTGSLPDGPYVVASRKPVPAAALSWRTFGAAYFAPLWLHDEVEDRWAANLPDGLLDRLRADGVDTDPDGLFNYVYAVANAREYRSRYRDGLRYEFARIPITRNTEHFRQTSALGRELTAIHLLEHPDLPLAAPPLDGDDRAHIAKPRYEEATHSLYLAPTLVARNITPEAWQYQQGAYPVLRLFLEAREARELSSDEFQEFRLLAGAVRLTLDRLPFVDALIPQLADTAFTASELGIG